ncbi:hypothetical protein M911_04990 [Ectothiorhodospira haloalkaliphila]|uniref:Uncharacterized protein n=1 Tax=Ectothiorhodospira haloalkaliphila TaxID=421628 RepID=W8KYM8_9GAMM|nr:MULTISPECIES: hypothetical protein [Ectothiorhodospira]AHK80621.1 hypothetical protein M911_04990 [Ectothiorhodospira haloalkaliphila]MCG5495484.1 hypothetical protein [Ectothiorhodospira variabilis]MCG5498925.1 hypothetical protein [Ectothiorhodospira variabilis]MCG5503907.1 hypothetical protein [Ectothiorhodospira variabilis]MCG5506962.1 hypothetical protein [Ectothiorhodospira variabilis]
MKILTLKNSLIAGTATMIIATTGQAIGSEWDHLLQTYVPAGAAYQTTLTTPPSDAKATKGNTVVGSVYDPHLQAFVGKVEGQPVGSLRSPAPSSPAEPANITGSHYDPQLQAFVPTVE